MSAISLVANRIGAEGSVPVDVRRISIACNTALIATAAFVLALWMSGTPAIEQLVWAHQMRPNAALGLLLGGIAIAAGRNGRTRLMTVCNGAVTAIGALTIAEYLLGVSLGIDDLLMFAHGWHEAWDARMAPQTAAALIFGGIAGLTARTRHARTRNLSDLCVAGTTFIALVSVVAGVYGGAMFPAHPAVTRVALATAVCILLWTTAGFTAMSDRGFAAVALARDAWGETVRRVSLAALFAPVIFGGLCLAAERAQVIDAAFAVALIATSTALTLVVTVSTYTARYRATEARFRSIYDTNIVGVCFRDANGTIVDANERFLQIHGLAPEDLGQTRWESLSAPAWRAADEQAVRERRRDGRSGTFQKEVIRPDGALVTIVATEASFDDKLGGSIGVAVDVTEQIAARQALDRTEKLLASRLSTLDGNADVTSSTLAVAARDLDVQRATVENLAIRLASANAELETFSYSVSHDLRAPLRSVDGFARELLLDYADKLDATGRNYLERITKNTERMAVLIDELLDLSRIGRRILRRQNVDVTHLAQTIAADASERIAGRNVEFRIQEGMILRADHHLLHIALENLIGNAVKFTATREQAVIEIGVEPIHDVETFFIRDNGIGFDPKYGDKLFTPFHRLQSKFEGNGIGLAIVRRIIERHDGAIWADAAPDEGATFYFVLGGDAGDDVKLVSEERHASVVR